MVRHFLSLPFLLLSLLLILLLLLSLLLLFLLLPLFLFLLLFAWLLSVCNVVLQHLPIHFYQSRPVPFSVGSSTTRNPFDTGGTSSVDQTLPPLKAMSWTASLTFKGHFCLKTDIFNASLETKYDLFQYTTSIYRGSKHIIWYNLLLNTTF